MVETRKLQQDTLAVDPDDERVFDFFGLPRELRNEIYALLTQVQSLGGANISNGGVPKGLEISVTNVPFPKLFGLCHQFKTEYEDALKHGLTIKFKDIGAEIYTPSIGDKSDNTTGAEIKVLAVCNEKSCNGHDCGAWFDLRDHVDWITAVVPELEKLRDLEIQVYKCQLGALKDISKHTPVIDDLLAELEHLSVTSRIEVYPYFVVEDDPDETHGAQNGVPAYEAGQAPEMVWTRTEGWQDV